MKALLRELAACTIRYCGLPLLIRNLWARRKVTIIVYHDPQLEVLERHLAYLRKCYRIIALDDVADAYARGDWSGIPPKALVVTFDDGHRGNFELLEVFRRHNVRPTIFLVTRVIDTRRKFWFRLPGLRSGDYKAHTHSRRLSELNRDFGYLPAREYPDEAPHALSRLQIEVMTPFVDFEAHTCFHPVLTTCSDEEARQEIADSRNDVEALLGRPCRHFSYPNGDYTQREVELARAARFQTARTVDVGWNDLRTDPLRLKITGVTDDASINILASQLTGITMYLRYFLKGGRGGRYPVVRVRPVQP